MGINVGDGTVVGVNVSKGNGVGVEVGEGAGVGVDIGTGVGVMVGRRVWTGVAAKVGAASASGCVRVARVVPQPPSTTAAHKPRINTVQIPVRLCFLIAFCSWIICVRGMVLGVDGSVDAPDFLSRIVWGMGFRPLTASSMKSCALACYMTVFPVRWSNLERNSPIDKPRNPTTVAPCQGPGTSDKAMVGAPNLRWVFGL